MDIEHFDIEEDILMCITINGPKFLINAILREALEDIKIADVRLINTKTQVSDNELILELTLSWINLMSTRTNSVAFVS
jgi:hypothetical protein